MAEGYVRTLCTRKPSCCEMRYTRRSCPCCSCVIWHRLLFSLKPGSECLSIAFFMATGLREHDKLHEGLGKMSFTVSNNSVELSSHVANLANLKVHVCVFTLGMKTAKLSTMCPLCSVCCGHTIRIALYFHGSKFSIK